MESFLGRPRKVVEECSARPLQKNEQSQFAPWFSKRLDGRITMA